MILTGLFALITTASAWQALAAERLSPVTLPEIPTLPAATYQIVGGSSEPTFQTSGMQKLRVQFDHYGNTYSDANGLREATRVLLNGYSGTLSDGTVLQKADLIQSVDYFENDARQYRCMSEFYLWFDFSS